MNLIFVDALVSKIDTTSNKQKKDVICSSNEESGGELKRWPLTLKVVYLPTGLLP